MTKKNPTTSSGHKLGQVVGDWFEQHVAARLLDQVAEKLNLYLDHRFHDRDCRLGKIIWEDLDANQVDYDFVIELNGDEHERGEPVAFFETFWRRGSRHSKDKARDDSGKLLPMRDTYPTARVLGIISAGDFTKPAQELVKSRSIDLFYIPKDKICEAWRNCGIEIDYPDKAKESDKVKIAKSVTSRLDTAKEIEIRDELERLVSTAVYDSYVARIVSHIASIPMEYKLVSLLESEPVVFKNHQEVTSYLEVEKRSQDASKMKEYFRYEVVYSDGSFFERSSLSREEAIGLHSAVGKVADYFVAYHTV